MQRADKFYASLANSVDVLYISLVSFSIFFLNCSTFFSNYFFSFFNPLSFFFLSWSFSPSSLNISSTSLIYFVVFVTFVVTYFRLYFFFAKSASKSLIYFSSSCFRVSDCDSWVWRGFLRALRSSSNYLSRLFSWSDWNFISFSNRVIFLFSLSIFTVSF